MDAKSGGVLYLQSFISCEGVKVAYENRTHRNVCKQS